MSKKNGNGKKKKNFSRDLQLILTLYGASNNASISKSSAIFSVVANFFFSVCKCTLTMGQLSATHCCCHANNLAFVFRVRVYGNFAKPQIRHDFTLRKCFIFVFQQLLIRCLPFEYLFFNAK